MFEARRNQTRSRTALAILGLIYHSTVRDIRKSHRNPLVGLVLNIVQTVTFVVAFYLMFTLLGARGMGVRGDFLLYLMSGVFLYLTHIKAVAAVVRSDGPASSMMQHLPLNTAITISAAALSALYLQLLSLVTVLFLYHVLVTPIAIDQPLPALGMLLLAWFTGVGLGLVLLSLKPWFPDLTGILSSVWSRANMVFSGKMFVANALPGHMLALFDWNPLFHVIDQCRGFVFLNYTPHFTSPLYALWVGLGLLTLGLMGEFHTRRHASRSWNAAR